MLCVTIRSIDIEGYAYECPTCNNLSNLELSEITKGVGCILNSESERRTKLKEVPNEM